METAEANKNSDNVSVTYDDAVEIAGHGCYNYLQLLACSLTSLAVAMDMFGFSVVVAAASCDLQLSIAVTGLLNSIPLAGILFAFPWGYYADTQGRLRALVLSTTVGFAFAVMSSFSNSWQLMLALKFIGCSFSTASYTLTMTYLGECTGCKRRNRFLFFLNATNLSAEFVFYLLAYLILPLDFSYPVPWLGITIRSWRIYSVLNAVPLGIGALLMLLLHESPKLLASRGRNEEALVILNKIYERNGGEKDGYPVKALKVDVEQDQSKESFWTSIVKQTVPLFKPPLLWRTIQLFYLIALCGSTNNVFLMWYPKMVNLFFSSLSSGVEDHRSFCERVVANISTPVVDDNQFCDDSISSNTMYAGMILGLTFASANLAATVVASYRRLVLITAYFISAVSLGSVEMLNQPVVSLVAFTLVQCTTIGISSIASYFVDLYPTAYRALVTSLSFMVSRLVALGGVNLVAVIIETHCSLAFYCWTVYIISHGWYNYLQLLACSLTSLAVAMDMFGFSVVVAAASCDLQLTMKTTGLLNSIPLAGIIFAFPWGYYADTQGRLKALLLSTTVGFAFAVISSFANSWQLMLVLKFIGCSFSSAAYTLTITYLGECTGTAKRNRFLFMMSSANLSCDLFIYLLAYFILPFDFSYPITWLGITLRPWRVFSAILAMPLGIGALLMLFLHESPRFLGSRGRHEEALVILKKIHEKNGGEKNGYRVKSFEMDLAEYEHHQTNDESFWNSIVKQTVPLFKPPLIWRTIHLFYLIAICGSTNNVFVLWYPKIVNIFFNSLASGTVDDRSFCERVVANISEPAMDGNQICNDTISPNTMYAGMILGLTVTTMNLVASAVASYRRLVLITVYLIAAVCLLLVENLKTPVLSLVAFALVQCTDIGTTSVASYFVDLYPTTYRALVTSLSCLVSRIVGLGGVNVVAEVIESHCSTVFYCWTAYVVSGIVLALFLPSDRKRIII